MQSQARVVGKIGHGRVDLDTNDHGVEQGRVVAVSNAGARRICQAEWRGRSEPSRAACRARWRLGVKRYGDLVCYEFSSAPWDRV